MAALIVIILATAACDRPMPHDGQLVVVATTTQVGSVAAEVGGHDIELRVLLPPGAEAHEYELSAEDAAAIERADLVLISGAGLETWLTEALQTIGGEDKIRDMSVGVDLRQTTPMSGEPAETDPHYWLSAPNAIRMVENVRDALNAAASDASLDAALAERAEALVQRLQEADDEIHRLINEIPVDRRRIVTNHDALGYFLAEYGLRFVGSIFPSLDVSAEPSAADLAALVETIRSQDVSAIFSESAVNPSLAQAIANETGIVVSDEALYTDSLGAPGSGAETLDGMLLWNARVIHDVLTEGLP